uniref:Uncharacterized protein n=1 Tax=Rangifer tarandus platyrhynchus TaxID=3082113 RepID=A0ACB0EW32_RANTA|nr:unnamed protein product [Rangifer tarandus platyrhynchus]
MLHKTPRVSRQLRLPSAQLAQPPASPAKAWHCCPGCPSPCQQARKARGRGQIAFPAGSALLPQEKASVFPPPAASAWLRGTRAPGCKVTGPHGIHLQPHQLPGNRIPAADDSRGLQDRAPIQRPLEPAWPDLAAASPAWALLHLGTNRPEPVLPRPPIHLGATGWVKGPSRHSPFRCAGAGAEGRSSGRSPQGVTLNWISGAHLCPRGDQGQETASRTVLGGVQSLSDADEDLDGTDLQGSVLPPASRTLGLPCGPSLPTEGSRGSSSATLSRG